MQKEYLNKKKQNEALKKQNMTNEQIIEVLEDIVGEDGDVNIIGEGDENPKSFFFGEKNSYNYVLTIDNDSDKYKYLNVTLHFGTMEDFLSRKEMEELPALVYDENNKHRCVRGILEKNENSEEDIWMDFEVSYDSYSFPGISPLQLRLHIEMAKESIVNYLLDTLDEVHGMDDVND